MGTTEHTDGPGQDADLASDPLDEPVEAGERDEAEALPEGQLVQELLDDVGVQLRQRALERNRQARMTA